MIIFDNKYFDKIEHFVHWQLNSFPFQSSHYRPRYNYILTNYHKDLPANIKIIQPPTISYKYIMKAQ